MHLICSHFLKAQTTQTVTIPCHANFIPTTNNASLLHYLLNPLFNLVSTHSLQRVVSQASQLL